ncbi:MAG TPA: dTMP kinase [Coprothermobacter proteolyticus]|uniref:Thymidylate kinase n=1 Tax=Coprothermobacter proteolyticus (strain ATCC 35245 / DSM 5265 / OCM 4 / BT) TaxID=309798 RepID=KTHY_COPPD|nr:dTMP kinase [Coprothermobacter proteolyticus]B5Y7S6.1 RecName: Full=Thymidylate kinase; AltName: Full=dTMP kinase [Coprothermobacter proteolyticus DSM 5265]ACI17900.1 thymidylate kinase [Coprothermobacter proteolyticus DSM 5265]HPZ45139.1 dTMP kinase [Coprothermobacter proteolyticus]
MFIVVEGIDGCGKSTVASLLAAEIGKKRPVFHTFEPGHVRDGLYRELIMENVDNPFVVAALFTIDRAEHVKKMIKPALAKGEWVVCERYADSTLAYQGYGMGLDKELINRMNEEAIDGLWPDKIFYLDIEPHLALARLQNKEKDALEGQGLEFLQRVREGYEEIARTRGYIYMDATLPPEIIVKRILEEVKLQ